MSKRIIVVKKGEVSEVVGILDRITDGLESLSRLGVIRTRRPLHADLAEWLVAQLLGGELAESTVQRGWDVLAGGKRLQVRSHSKAASNTTKWTHVASGDYDTLVIVVFDPMYRVKGIYSIPFSEIPEVQLERERVQWRSLAKQRLFPGDLKIPKPLRRLFTKTT
jgi:hypothetical protein